MGPIELQKTNLSGWTTDELPNTPAEGVFRLTASPAAPFAAIFWNIGETEIPVCEFGSLVETTKIQRYTLKQAIPYII